MRPCSASTCGDKGVVTAAASVMTSSRVGWHHARAHRARSAAPPPCLCPGCAGDQHHWRAHRAASARQPARSRLQVVGVFQPDRRSARNWRDAGGPHLRLVHGAAHIAAVRNDQRPTPPRLTACAGSSSAATKRRWPVAALHTAKAITGPLPFICRRASACRGWPPGRVVPQLDPWLRLQPARSVSALALMRLTRTASVRAPPAAARRPWVEHRAERDVHAPDLLGQFLSSSRSRRR